MCHFIWFGGIWALFPQIALMLKTDITWTLSRWPWHKSKTSFDVKWGTEVFGLLFVCPSAWFGVFRPSFPKLPQHLNIWETDITQPKEALDTRVRSHLMWNKKIKTLDYFSCVPACDLGYIFGSSFPKLPQYLSTCETGIAQPTEGNGTTVRSHLMWNKELNTLNYFSGVPVHDLGYLGPVSPKCPNTKYLWNRYS